MYIHKSRRGKCNSTELKAWARNTDGRRSWCNIESKGCMYIENRPGWYNSKPKALKRYIENKSM